MLIKTIPRIGRVPNVITVNARRINYINKISHPKKKPSEMMAFAPPAGLEPTTL